MFQLLFALVLVIWAVFVLGGLLVLFDVPCTIVISTAVVVLSGLYCWYRLFLFLGSFVHGLPLEYITAQANYTIDMTPPFVKVIRLWRTSQRKGFIGSADFYINKSVGFIGETALSAVRYVTKQHKFHVTLITCLIQILLWPLVMIAKGLILARYWLMTLLYWLIYDVNKLISTVVVSCNYFFGTSCRSPSLAALVSTVWTFTIGLPFRIIKPMKQAVESLLNLPYNAFKWVVSFMVPEQTMAKSNREIVLVILRKVPLIGKNALVQNTAARAMTSVNKALNGMTSLKDKVSSYIHCRYHVIKTEFHSYIDGYISLPLDVVMLYVKDTLVVKPGGVINKWIQDNLQFPDILQASNAMHGIHHIPEHHLSRNIDGKCKQKRKHRHHSHCKNSKEHRKEASAHSDTSNPQQHSMETQSNGTRKGKKRRLRDTSA